MQNRLFCASLLLAGFALPVHAQLAFQAPNPIALHAGSGEITFTLKNAGNTDKTVSLTPGSIIDSATHTVINGATAKIETGNPPTAFAPNTKIPADTTLSVTANISGISGASQAEFPILDGTSQVGSINAFASDAPLTVAIDGDGSAPDKTLAYTLGNPVVIALKNSDAQTYHVHWIFQINNLNESSGDTYLAASGSSRFTITPTGTPFSLLDWIHPSSKKGVLLLSVIPPPGVPDGLLPTRSLSVSLVMQPLSSFWSAFLSYSYVAVLLLIGGLLSFLASSMLPNMQKKGVLRAQLQNLANRTNTVSTRIDSYLRVLLRLERSRIKDLIDNAPAWIPASADPLVQATASIDNLSKRLAAAERLDDMRRKHEQVSATAPPSVTDGIDANLQAAADQLHSVALSDPVMTAANGFFAKAQAGLDLLDNTDALARQIAANVSLVMTRLAKFPPNYYADLKDSLPGVFLIADPTRGYNDPTNIVRPMLFAIDHGAAAIQLALDYAMVRASIPVMPSATPSAQAQPPAAAPAGVPAVPAPPAAPAAPTAPAADAAPPAPPVDDAQTAPANAAPPQAPDDSAAPVAPAANASLTAPAGTAVAAFINSTPAAPAADATQTAPANATPPAPPVDAAPQVPAPPIVPPVDAAPVSPAPAAPTAPPAPANALPAVPANAALQCDSLWDATRQRLLKRHCRLLELLGTLSWRALREATLLIQEMREDTYEEDILDEIGKENQAEIFFDTQRARPLQPVFFSIKFNNSRFNNAAALQRLMCHWTFPDDLDEYTWKVCHYFSGFEHDTVPPSGARPAILPQAATRLTNADSDPQKKPSHKRPHFLSFSRPAINRDLDLYATIRGQRVDEAREVPVPPLKKTIQIQSPPTTERSRFWAEILQFAIAFGVALAGLLSGGLEQLQKLDIIPASIAIIGLGFSASAIKNLLTQSAAPQTPAPAPTPTTTQQ